MLKNAPNYKHCRHNLVKSMDQKAKNNTDDLLKVTLLVKKKVGNRLLTDLAKADTIKKKTSKTLMWLQSHLKSQKKETLTVSKKSVKSANEKLNEYFSRINVSEIVRDYRKSGSAFKKTSKKADC